MKAGLGDDAQDGWLLLGGQGLSSGTGSTAAVRANAGATLSSHASLTAAAVNAALGRSPVQGGGGEAPTGNQRPR